MRTLKISLLVFILSITISSQNFWHQTNGPYGVPTVYDFLKYNDSTIFLGTNEGILRSKDNGETWERINGQYLNAQIRGITKDHFGTLYAGRYDTEYGLKMLFKSTDEGNTWNQMSWGDAEIRYIFIPYKDTIMVGSWDKGVYRSFDGGMNWSRVNNGNIYNGIYKIIQLTDGGILAGSAGGGVMKTTNWGDSWIASNFGITPNGLGQWHASSFLEISPGNIYTGTSTGIYYTTNYGDSWVYKGNGIPYNNSAKCIVEDGMGNLYAGIDISKGVYYSTNNGGQWYHLGLGHSIYTFGWDSDQRLYAGGLSAGLFRFAFEDSSWTRVVDQGYNPVEVNHLWITASGNLIAGTQGWGLKYSTDSGINWKSINAPTGFYAIETINDSIIIGGGSQNAYVSNDTGKTWMATGNFRTSSIYYESVSQSVYVGTDRDYPNICAIYRSKDFGQNWELIYNFPHLTEGQWVNSLHVTKTNQVILCNVVYSSQFGGSYIFYKSTDFGQLWQIIIEGEYIRQIIEDDSSNIFALSRTDGKRLFFSEDEFETWIVKNIPQTECIVVDYSGRLFRAFSNHIYYSEDKGSTWIEVDNSGLDYIAIYDAVIDHNNRIYLATNEGVYFGEADSIVLSTEKFESLKTFYISQNYPNPFNPSTKFRYEISERNFVTLKVYDILGREVATLVNEEKPAGEYEIEFNATNLPSGIYFYQLKAGEYRETKKMVLLK